MIAGSFGRYLARTAHDHGGRRGRLAVAPARGRLAVKAVMPSRAPSLAIRSSKAALGWLTAAITSGIPRVSSIIRGEIRTGLDEPARARAPSTAVSAGRTS